MKKRNWIVRMTALSLGVILLCGSAVPARAQGALVSPNPGAESTEEAEETIGTIGAEESTEAANAEHEPADMPTVLTLDAVRQIPEGIVINGVDVSGMVGVAASDAVKQSVAEDGATLMNFMVGENVTSVPLSDFGLSWQNEAIMATACDAIDRGSLLTEYRVRKQIEQGDIVMDPVYTIDADRIRSAMDELLLPLNVEPQNAKLSRNADGTWNITKEVNGIVGDPAQAADLAVQAFNAWDGGEINIDVPVTYNMAAIDSSVFEGMSTKPIASCTTDYVNQYNHERDVNVTLGAKHINNHVWMPDEAISVSQWILPITEAEGWGDAHAYESGSVRLSLGGGACQVASTFYFAAMELELEIIKRKAHSMEVSYLPPAFDATVNPLGEQNASWDDQYLIIRNNTGHAIYVEGYTDGTYITFNFYGVDPRPANRTVKYRSVTLSENNPGNSWTRDPNITPGTQQVDVFVHVGRVAQMWKDVYVDGVLTDSILVHTDTYRARPSDRRYGPVFDAQGREYTPELTAPGNGDMTGYWIGPEGVGGRWAQLWQGKSYILYAKDPSGKENSFIGPCGEHYRWVSYGVMEEYDPSEEATEPATEEGGEGGEASTEAPATEAPAEPATEAPATEAPAEG